MRCLERNGSSDGRQELATDRRLRYPGKVKCRSSTGSGVYSALRQGRIIQADATKYSSTRCVTLAHKLAWLCNALHSATRLKFKAKADPVEGRAGTKDQD
jgi:hypothetical protein